MSCDGVSLPRTARFVQSSRIWRFLTTLVGAVLFAGAALAQSPVASSGATGAAPASPAALLQQAQQAVSAPLDNFSLDEIHRLTQLRERVAHLRDLAGQKADAGTLETRILQAQIKDFAAFDFPFLFNNDKEVDALVDGPFGQTLHKKLQDKGLVGLAYFDLGFRNITNGKHAINKPEDIAGLKLRVIQSPIYVDVFKALGANPTPLAWPEVYNALEQGAVDGQENPFTVILNAKLDEVQKYLAITRHIYNPQSVIISKKFWDSLNPDEQKLIQEAADEAAAYQRKVSRDAALTALETLKKHGMQVTELSPADLDKMREMVKPVVEKYTQEVGEDTIKSMYAEIDKIRKP